MAGARNHVTLLTVHMSKIKILVDDLSTGRLTPNTIAPKDLKIYLGQIKVLIGKCNTFKTLYIRIK